MKLWLDDQWEDASLPMRNPPEGWIGIATIEEAKTAILRLGKYVFSEPVTEISFDNDLGEGIKEGYELACWIEAQAYNGAIPRMTWDVHSANPVRAKDIATAMTNADKYWDENEIPSDK